MARTTFFLLMCIIAMAILVTSTVYSSPKYPHAVVLKIFVNFVQLNGLAWFMHSTSNNVFDVVLDVVHAMYKADASFFDVKCILDAAADALANKTNVTAALAKAAAAGTSQAVAVNVSDPIPYFYMQQAVYMASPIVLLLLAVVPFLGITIFFFCKHAVIGGVPELFSERYDKTKGLFLQIFIIFIFLVYPNILLSVLNMFNCKKVGGVSYLYNYSSEECWTWDHQLWIYKLAAPTLLLDIIGLPVLTFLMIRRRRIANPDAEAEEAAALEKFKKDEEERKLLEEERKAEDSRLRVAEDSQSRLDREAEEKKRYDEAMEATKKEKFNKETDGEFFESYGFLYDGYKDEYFAWEMLILLRKIAIVFVVVFFSYTPLIQSLMALAIATVSLIAQMTIKPYKDPTFNFLEAFSIFCSFTTFYMGHYFLITTDKESLSDEKMGYGVVIAIVILAYTLVTLVVFAKIVAEMIRVKYKGCGGTGVQTDPYEETRKKLEQEEKEKLAKADQDRLAKKNKKTTKKDDRHVMASGDQVELVFTQVRTTAPEYNKASSTSSAVDRLAPDVTNLLKAFEDDGAQDLFKVHAQSKPGEDGEDTDGYVPVYKDDEA